MSDSSPTIPWRTRSDLEVVQLDGDSEQVYAVKDTISNEYFRFGEVELFILQSLKKTFTVHALKQILKERFGLSLSNPDISSYLQHLATDNLLVAHGFGDGARLYRQHERKHSQGWAQKALRLMSIKLPGFYPGPLLSTLEPIGRLLFHPLTIVVTTFLFLITTIYAVLTWQTLLQRAPSLAELLSAEHLILMAVGFVLAKLLHEIGHGLACRQTGHECSEMGVLLLVMLPCLYCDVSDMWTERNRFKKLQVSLAGVFVELGLAMLCFWGWHFSIDGTLNRFLFGMMLVTSVNTIFVNGNPLMKYDGYYAMADLLNVHNLSGRAQRCLTQTVEGLFFRIEPHHVLNQQNSWVRFYAISAFCYRWVILFAIGWMAWTFFKNLQLLMLGRAAVLIFTGIALLPACLGILRFGRISWTHGIRWGNTLALGVILAITFWGIGNFEFQHRVSGLATMELAGAEQVFASGDGLVLPKVADGDLVNAGETIAQIVNDQLFIERITAREQVNDVLVRLKTLELRNNGSAAADIEFWKQRQASWQRKLDSVNSQISKLNVKAPVSGQFVAQKFSAATLADSEERLVATEGTWTGLEHAGASVTRGENLGYVANTKNLTGTLRITEKDIELVEKEQVVRVFFPFETRFLVGHVSGVSLESVPTPSSVTRNVEMETETPPQYYRVEFQFPVDQRVKIGASRKAVILCRKTNVVQWVKRWLSNTFWL